MFSPGACRGGLPRRTGPRCLPETARLRGVPNPGEGLPPRVPRQLPGGRGRTEHLLHPPPQQAQEIHLPVHRWLLLRPGGGEGGEVRLYKVFLIMIKKESKRIKKRQRPQQKISSNYVLCSCPICFLHPHPRSRLLLKIPPTLHHHLWFCKNPAKKV